LTIVLMKCDIWLCELNEFWLIHF